MSPRERIETPRLVLRKPVATDADAIFSRYASDPLVTRYLSWPTHRAIEDTQHFLEFSASEWERWPAGPYLIESTDGVLLGGTGLRFESDTVAGTGYLFARDAWGQGFATECLQAMIELARELGVRWLQAGCHPENGASRRVLEKCGFTLHEQKLAVFPNLTSEPQRGLRFTLDL